jgi:hypothetical protein
VIYVFFFLRWTIVFATKLNRKVACWNFGFIEPCLNCLFLMVIMDAAIYVAVQGSFLEFVLG